MKIINKESVIADRIQNQETRHIPIFLGSMEENAKMANADLLKDYDNAFVQMSAGKWEGSKSYVELWRNINNLKEKVVNQNSVPSDLAGLIQLLFVDVTRRVMEQVDFTSMLCTETTNFNYPESVLLREIYKYRGVFQPTTLENGSVPLIEQFSGAVDTVVMAAWSIGWKDTLRNLLYNDLFSMQKVLQAVAEAYVNERNDQTLGQVYGSTFVNSQQVHAVNTAGVPYDTNLYDTYRHAYKQLIGLLDPQNDKMIAHPTIALLIHPSRRWESERVIRGYLEQGGANTGAGQMRPALPIDEIWEHAGDSYTWGKKKIDFAGCDPDKAYLFVPRLYSFVLVKRPLTMEVGRGSVLQLSTEERAWYFVQARYGRDFMGSSWPGTTLKGGYGAIVEISLPTDGIET
jgi:hypothetical protein